MVSHFLLLTARQFRPCFPRSLAPTACVKSSIPKRAMSSFQSNRYSVAVGNTINLPDGRMLGYHEFGDTQGSPVIYIHGSPDSGITLSGCEDKVAKKLGVRLIAPDRPGIGLSTFQPDRKVVDFVADLRHLIDHLGLRRYRILGTSGGTGYTLASARDLPRNELEAVGIVAGMGPWEAGLMGQSEQMQTIMMCWKNHRSDMVALMESLFYAAAQDRDPAVMEAKWKEQLDGFAAKDRDVLSQPDAVQSAAKVFRQIYAQGGAGHGHEMKLNTKPWGIDLERITYEKVLLWYGSDDINTPPEMGRYLAQKLPKAVYKEYRGETHYSIWRAELVTEVLQDLLKVSR